MVSHLCSFAACRMERAHSHRSGLSVLHVHHGDIDLYLTEEVRFSIQPRCRNENTQANFGNLFNRHRIGWFSKFCYYWPSAPDGLSFGEKLWNAVWTFDRIRISGVMQRLAVCYGAASIVALTVKHRYIPYLIAALLTGYFLLLMAGNGFAYDETNILLSSTVPFLRRRTCTTTTG